MKINSIRFLIVAIISIATLSVFQNCSKSTFSASNSESGGKDDTQILSQGGCRFTGGAIENGGRVWAYQNSGVPAGSQCVVEERACQNGVLSGSFNFRSCNVGAPSACIFNGQQIEDGDSVDAYETSSVAFGSNCNLQSRKCNNGTLTGNFEFGSCTPGAPLSCLFNGQQMAHGAQPVTAFETSTVPFGQNCKSQPVSCNNGALSGTYRFASCNPGAPASCTHNGQTIPHQGQTGFLYTTSSVPFGSSCPAPMQRTCLNGTLTNSTAIHASCTPGPQPTCGDGAEFNTTTLSCQSCADSQNYSISQKRCVAACSGGVVIRLRYTNTATVETAENPIGFNFDAGFTINRNGTDYVIGKPGPSTTFKDKMNLAVSQNLEYAGVRDAYQSGINEVAGLSGVSVTLGNVFDVLVNIQQSVAYLPGREIVISGSGNFRVKSYSTEGSAPGSHQYSRVVWCK